MDIHKQRTNLQPEMNAEPTFDFADRLIAAERDRGETLAMSVRIVARNVRMGPGSLENIFRRRVKRIDGRVRDRLRAALITMLERRIEADRNELAMVRALGCDQGSDAELLAELATDLEALRARLKALQAPEKFEEGE